MVKRILLVSSFIVLSGCYEQNNNSSQFNWAEVNSSLLEKEILEVAEDKYPYPDEIAMDRSELREERSKLSSQISNIRSDLKEKCILDKKGEDKIKKEPVAPALQHGYVMRAPTKLKSLSSHYDYDCIRKVDSDPLIQDLNDRKDKLSAISRKQSEHDRKLRDLSKIYARELISEYSKSKLEIVVDSERDHILYNASGVTVDITDVLISKVDKNQLGPLSDGKN